MINKNKMGRLDILHINLRKFKACKSVCSHNIMEWYLQALKIEQRIYMYLIIWHRMLSFWSHQIMSQQWFNNQDIKKQRISNFPNDHHPIMALIQIMRTSQLDWWQRKTKLRRESKCALLTSVTVKFQQCQNDLSISLNLSATRVIQFYQYIWKSIT